jgi:Serine dehydrogenase proteinase
MARKPPVGGEEGTPKVVAPELDTEAPSKKSDESTAADPSKQSEPGPTKPPRPKTWTEALRLKDDEAFKELLASKLQGVINKHALDDYEVLFLFDDDKITSFHSDRLYSAASPLRDSRKNILLILHSPGGGIEPAYLISKTLKRIARDKFSVAVPRRAKSAATLLALGADEIHMGMISQLGPIDPQVYGLPALALGNALNHVADLVCKFPGSVDMLTKYLIDQAPIRTLGYFERVSESAAQYAERLLHGKTLAPGKSEQQIAKHLVQHYKDHGFVIDTEEAKDLLGGLIKEQTAEYRLADELYTELEWVDLVLRSVYKKTFWIVGSLSDGIATGKLPEQ